MLEVIQTERLLGFPSDEIEVLDDGRRLLRGQTSDPYLPQINGRGGVKRRS